MQLKFSLGMEAELRQRLAKALFEALLWMLIKSHQGMALLLGGNSFPISRLNRGQGTDSVDSVEQLLVYLPESGQEPLRAGALGAILPSPKQIHLNTRRGERRGLRDP